MTTINTKEINDKIASLPSIKDLSKEYQRQEDISAINDYALRNPNKVFGDDFKEQRKHLTEETWKAVILANPDMLDSASDKWRKIPDVNIVNKYQGQAFSGEVRKAINEDGVKLGLASTLGPAAMAFGLEAAGAPIVQKGFQLAGQYGKLGFNWLSQQADKAFPWILKNVLPTLNKLDPMSKEFAAMGMAGKLGVGALESTGLYEAGRSVYDFVLNPSVSKIPETALSAMAVLPYSQVLNTPYKIASLPGYMLKQLMPGSKLEKALSKVGTIDVNSIRAMFKPGTASESEIEIVNNVLNDTFSGLSKIDYNAFRKAVQDEIITYTKKPQTKFTGYGMDRLGYKRVITPDGAGGNVEYIEGIPTSTFTFESHRIPQGSNKHYDPTSLGHTRTYVDPAENNVLHILESLSDWGQSHFIPYEQDSPLFNEIKYYEHLMEEAKKYNDPFYYEAKKTYDYLASMASKSKQEQYLHDNYLFRQLQENMKYAAEQGKTKMRYPTSETAIKIQGFEKGLSNDILIKINEIYKEQMNISKIYRDKYSELMHLPQTKERDLMLLALYNKVMSQLSQLDDEIKMLELTADYPKQHKTIIKKYEDFPKLYKKIFKSDPVIVTDTKGNTWYEVDVPQGYLNLEWQYKNGGKINYLNLFK